MLLFLGQIIRLPESLLQSRLELSCFSAFVVPRGGKDTGAHGSGIAGAALCTRSLPHTQLNKSFGVTLSVQRWHRRFCEGFVSFPAEFSWFYLLCPGFTSFVRIPFTHSYALLCCWLGLLRGIILSLTDFSALPFLLRDERAQTINEGILKR